MTLKGSEVLTFAQIWRAVCCHGEASVGVHNNVPGLL